MFLVRKRERMRVGMGGREKERERLSRRLHAQCREGLGHPDALRIRMFLNIVF